MYTNQGTLFRAMSFFFIQYSLKILNLLKQKLIFLIQLLLKILVIEFNNRFVFHQTSAVDIQLILDIFLFDLDHDFVECGNTLRLSAYFFPVVAVRELPP